ncbi:hypothetical protein AHU16_22825 [Salmonella enterica subsp. enterica serovar Give]|nr:hypothetical protein [Salmonella enterica subsp. enterica serovar Give]
MSEFEFTDYAGADEVFVPTQVELPAIEIYATCNNVNVLTSLIIMKNIATEVCITEPHSLHVIVSNSFPLFVGKRFSLE